MSVRSRKAYKSDLTDEQWAILEPLVPPEKPGGRHRAVDMRELMNTILYHIRAGCPWDFLPHDLLPKSTVYDYFAKWRDDGTWQRIMDALRKGTHPRATATPQVGTRDFARTTNPKHLLGTARHDKQRPGNDRRVQRAATCHAPPGGFHQCTRSWCEPSNARHACPGCLTRHGRQRHASQTPTDAERGVHRQPECEDDGSRWCQRL